MHTFVTPVDAISVARRDIAVWINDVAFSPPEQACCLRALSFFFFKNDL